VSGGQTGVDRAALDFAIENHIPHGGWCPSGRIADDGIIPSKYELKETISAEYHDRTEKNVLDSDGTVIFARDTPSLTGGTLLTESLAKAFHRPLLTISEKDDVQTSARRIISFIQTYSIDVLNIAGPRERESPGLNKFVTQILQAVLQLSTTL